jgi:peptidoglycan/LPS O-acetylase OafA/YrhL
MSKYFLTHYDRTNLIDLEYASHSLYVVCITLLLLIIYSFVYGKNRQREMIDKSDLFSVESGLVLKGLAIILLLLGHLSQQLTINSQALPFRITGNAAVIIFLFISGVGLGKKYHLRVNRAYWGNRIRKIVFPLWMSLVLFLFLNHTLIKQAVSIKQIILSFGGIFSPGLPNSPCWFITYILFLYGVYAVAASMPGSKLLRVAGLFAMSFIAGLIISSTELADYIEIWVQYSLVFPAGVACGLITTHLKKISDKVYTYSAPFYVICLVILLGHYWSGLAVYRISHLVQSQVFTDMAFAVVSPVSLILFIVFFVALLERWNLDSGLLRFLGRYSFEIYLMHFPFMVYYDFFLYRKPLVLYFFIYCLFVICLSILLQKLSGALERLLPGKPVSL